jgi:hypothetical protein
MEVSMADWKISGTYLEFCNCDPGCGCNFKGLPNSPEGNCEAFVAHRIEGGSYDGLDLVGAEVAWALWWPGAIHDGGGRGHAYVDCPSDEQFEALSRMWRGEDGYSYFEVFNSTFGEPTAVDRVEIDMTVDGKSSRVAIEGVGEGVMTPLRSPVSGEENSVRIVTDGFIWKDGEIAQGERMAVDIPEMNFDVSGRHAVFAPFEYASG